MKNDEFQFGVNVETNDRTGEVMAVYFHVRKGKAAKTKECKEGAAYADYDSHGRLLGVELLAPCEVEVLDKIAAQKRPREFIRNAVPKSMLVGV